MMFAPYNKLCDKNKTSTVQTTLDKLFLQRNKTPWFSKFLMFKLQYTK